MARDKDYIKLIHSQQWLHLRKAVLSSHPLCQMCEEEGRLTSATEVHHRNPVEYGLGYNEKRRLMYDPSNLMALCHECHVKVHTEMGRSGKAATRRRVEAQVGRAISKLFDNRGDGGGFFKEG